MLVQLTVVPVVREDVSFLIQSCSTYLCFDCILLLYNLTGLWNVQLRVYCI